MDEKPGSIPRKTNTTCRYSSTNASDRSYISDGQTRSAIQNSGIEHLETNNRS
jgi:hypothetical protein